MTGRGIRERLPELGLEALMVIFAVLVALGVDEWREGMQYRDLAVRARTGVLTEVGANLDELEATRDVMSQLQQNVSAAVDSIDAGRQSSLSLSLELPDFSDAAWQAAQVTRAAPYLDYDWVIRVARVYQSQELYNELRSQLLESFSVVVQRGSERDALARMQAQLTIMLQVHDELSAELRALIDEG